MSVDIDWAAFLSVFIAALIAATLIVALYATGLRMLVRAGRAPVVSPAEFTDAITIISAKDIRRAEKQAAKAAKKSPLTPAQRMFSLVIAYACFALCGAAVITGVLIIFFHH
ncbi:hypothetical protein FM104_07830 [Microbacterium esteraromaticum]|uniref:Peptidase n=1 Tax=Microbacterium esteraromaticum TaxID=57043 RepID=A0A1R4JJ46_9MICO|nr:peptidase [Microbacterium esteraromaticum]SJN32281.1 hypothetical protein FM104_07830 [Microbacterium esteraromaticum]